MTATASRSSSNKSLSSYLPGIGSWWPRLLGVLQYGPAVVARSVLSISSDHATYYEGGTRGYTDYPTAVATAV